MKIHRVRYSVVVQTDGLEGVVVSHQKFHTSDGEASKHCSAIKKEFKDTLDDKPEREAIDIPTTRADLVAWLNDNAAVAGVVIS